VNLSLVGAFVVGLAAVLIAAALWLASGGASQSHDDLYLAVVDESVAGLNLNAPVKYNGVDVGQVREIRLDPANPARVRLVFAIARGTPIRIDTVAVLKTQGLTGIAYVEMAGGAPDAPPLLAQPPERLPQIRTKASLSARLENVLTDVLAKIERTSSNIDALLSNENRAAVASALADIAAVAHTIAGRKGSIDAGLAGAQRTFEQTALASVQIAPTLDRISRGAEAVERLGNEAARASTSAARTVETVGADVQRMSTDTLPELQRLLGELSVLSNSLRRLSEQTEDNPRGLLFGRSPVADGPGESGAGAKPP
jgi:phospholipid/cholesterol/gamma-HCH transport system substrate-binding protein